MKTTESQRRHVGKWRGAEQAMKTPSSLCMENIVAELQFAVAAISRAVILGRGSAVAADLARLLEAAAATLDLVEKGDLNVE